MQRNLVTDFYSAVTLAVLALALNSSIPRGHAATLRFTVTDVADAFTGPDRWEYTYALEGFTFAANQGFTIYFDRDLYGDLLPSPTSEVDIPEWSVLAFQADSLLNADGFYDALALRCDPALAGPFTVSAVWRGHGEPGPQPFVIYDVDFQSLSQGMTVRIPEPSAVCLAAVGLVLLCRPMRCCRVVTPGRIEPGPPRANGITASTCA